MNENQEKNASIGMTLGICGTALALASVKLAVFSLAISIIGLVLSIKAKRKLSEKGLPTGIGTAGFILGIIGVVLSSLNVLALSDYMSWLQIHYR